MVRTRVMGTMRQINGGSMNTHTTIRGKFVQVTGLLRESSDWNTGKMIMNRLHHCLKGIFWSLNFIFTQLGTIWCLFLGK